MSENITERNDKRHTYAHRRDSETRSYVGQERPFRRKVISSHAPRINETEVDFG
jgi:hypothetical protein